MLSWGLAMLWHGGVTFQFHCQGSPRGAQCQPCCDQPWLFPCSHWCWPGPACHPGHFGSALHESSAQSAWCQLCAVLPAPQGCRALRTPVPEPLLTHRGWGSLWFHTSDICWGAVCGGKVSTPLWALSGQAQASLCSSVCHEMCVVQSSRYPGGK